MGWERRQRGGLYYTRSKKVNGRVVREYVGTGQSAEAISQLDAGCRQRREGQAAEWTREREWMDCVDAQLNRLYDATEELTRRVLLAAGYHRHNRGEWRRKRG